MKNNSKEVILNLGLPGFHKEDINIKIREKGITVKAAKKQHSKVQKKDFFHEEKSYRSFSYVTTLPKIQPEKAKIKFNKGKLQIIAPKKEIILKTLQSRKNRTFKLI